MIGSDPDFAGIGWLCSACFRLACIASLLAASVLTLPALGASLPSSEEPLFPTDKICTPGADENLQNLDPLRLIRWLIAISDIGDAALDTDGDGDTLLSEKQLALVQPGYCTQDVGRACTAEEAETLQRIQDRLGDFVDRAGGPSYVFERLRRPTIEERVESDFLNPFFEVTGRRFQVAEVLDVEKRFVEIYCTALEPDEPIEVADVPAPEIVEEEEIPLWIFNPRDADGLRLTSEIDDLTKDRGALGTVRPAELSITTDLEDDETLYQVKAVVGYNFEVKRSDLIFTSTIPFLLFERFFNGEENEIDKLGIGVQEAFNVFQPDRSGSEVAITPLYLTDSDFDSDIGVLKLRWTPTLAPDSTLPIGFFERMVRWRCSSRSTRSPMSDGSSMTAATAISRARPSSSGSVVGSASSSVVPRIAGSITSSSMCPTATSKTSMAIGTTSIAWTHPCPTCSANPKTTGSRSPTRTAERTTPSKRPNTGKPSSASASSGVATSLDLHRLR